MKKNIIALSLLVMCLSAGSRLFAMAKFDLDQISQCNFLENQQFLRCEKIKKDLEGTEDFLASILKRQSKNKWWKFWNHDEFNEFFRKKLVAKKKKLKEESCELGCS